jgi:hypothetical protein
MIRNAITIIVALTLPISSAWSQAPGGSLGIYADPAGTSNEITVPQFVATDFYILARPNVVNLFGGLTGAEFRVKGSPPVGMLFVPTASPAAAITLGNPFSDESQPLGSRGGCNIAFASCQAPDANGFVLLYTVTAVDFAVVANVFLEVDKKDPPSNPFNAAFPEFNECSLDFIATEVDGLNATINRTTIAIEGRAWGAVKNLYR